MIQVFQSYASKPQYPTIFLQKLKRALLAPLLNAPKALDAALEKASVAAVVNTEKK